MLDDGDYGAFTVPLPLPIITVQSFNQNYVDTAALIIQSTFSVVFNLVPYKDGLINNER